MKIKENSLKAVANAINTKKKGTLMRQSAIAKLFIVTLLVAVFVAGCDNLFESNEPQSSNSVETQKFMKVAENSSSVNSFTPNYNEEQAMALAGSLGKDVYPIKIGQKMNLIEKNLTLEKDSTTATGTLTQKFEGRLIIQGSFKQPTIGIRQTVDTTIEKTFTSVITRIIQYKKVGNSGNDEFDWKVDAVSLPYGGTEGENIQIVRIILTSQDGTELVIDDPNAYLFKVGREKIEDDDEEDDDNHGFENGFGSHGHAWKNLLTWYKKNQTVKLTVEVLSTTQDPDFLSVTYGAALNGNTKSKEKFDFVSSQQEGSIYRKVYERKWRTNYHAARMHAVINAFPRTVVYDIDTAVEVKTWGIPYRVK
ncbi:MAG: hypothetical protein WCZ90_17710 [Melioribacteraceae bacterium]